MILHRITSKMYARDLSGTGAMLYGGRWNGKGIPMLYTSESLSLAALEVIANIPGDKLSNTLYTVEIDFPDHLPISTPETLPADWKSYPYSHASVELGNAFIKSEGLCLKVPSAIIQTEFNYLLNPAHEDYHHVTCKDARPLILDQRLFI